MLGFAPYNSNRMAGGTPTPLKRVGEQQSCDKSQHSILLREAVTADKREKSEL